MSDLSLRLKSHPLRQILNDEIHARPPVVVEAPMQIFYLAYLQNTKEKQEQYQCLKNLYDLYEFNQEFIEQSPHVQLVSSQYTLKWEQHNEFSGFTFFYPSSDESVKLSDFIQSSWLETIPGRLLVATHINVVKDTGITEDEFLRQNVAQTVVASRIAGDRAWVRTDFRIHQDGFSRFSFVNRSLTKQRAGRLLQRLLEIEIYRLIALLGFPLAKEVGGGLYASEQELAEIIHNLNDADTTETHSSLLSQLTKLAAEQEKSIARTTYRFSATNAYFKLVNQRIIELKEVAFEGYSSIRGFMDRRLTPAMNTCLAISKRQDELSSRINRCSELLRTRVNIEMEKQNQNLLAQMNQRAEVQLRLQETVEGLSVVVLTYYCSQLVQYLAKGSKDWHHFSPDVITAVSIPIIALFFTLSARFMHKKLSTHQIQCETPKQL